MLSILAGKDESYAGKLFYNECLINNKNKNDYADNHVTYVPQNSFVLEDETVLDNVLSDASIWGVDLKALGMDTIVCRYFQGLIAGPGAVAAVLNKYTS